MQRGRIATGATAAADALRQHPDGAIAGGAEQSGVQHLHRSAGATVATAAAEGDGQADGGNLVGRHALQRRGDRRTAFAATAADTLRPDAIGVAAESQHLAQVVSLDRAADSARAATAADGGRGGELQVRGDRHGGAAVAAATAYAHRVDADRMAAGGLDDAQVLRRDGAAVATLSADAANRQGDEALGRAEGVAASAAAAAHTLGADAP